jgi:glycosyltransferase involved in cell wall biosynthesis
MNSNKVWGGGEKWHYEAACHLDALGYSVMVITNKNSELYNKLIDHKSILLESKQISNFSFLNPYKLFYFKNLFQRNKVSAIFLGLSIDVKLGGMAAKMAKLEHIIYRRGSAIPVRNSIVNRYLFRNVLTRIITNSLEIKQNIFKRNPKIIDENKVQIVYNGINLKKWPNLDFFKNGKDSQAMLTLGNAGRLVEQKGQEYLIKIACLLKDQDIPFKLLIAGSGKLEKSLKNECKIVDLNDEVVFMDFVEDMGLFLRSLDIYLSTSLHEGSSNVILEAMGAGKPVIAFNVSSMPELIDEGETGYLVPFADTDLFTEKIISLRDNQSELTRLGTNARKQVESKFNFTTNMQKIIRLIENQE